MNSLRGLSLRAATLAALLPGAAFAHPGHGAHAHAEWAGAFIVAAVVGGLIYFARRNPAN